VNRAVPPSSNTAPASAGIGSTHDFSLKVRILACLEPQSLFNAFNQTQVYNAIQNITATSTEVSAFLRPSDGVRIVRVIAASTTGADFGDNNYYNSLGICLTLTGFRQ
jgi:hypothetical protein